MEGNMEEITHFYRYDPVTKDWQEQLAAANNIPPDSNTRGYRKLRAFSHRPEDLHIEYWREIIGENFDKLFQKTQKNPFLALCKYLKIPATAKLTEGYEKNPFAPLWAIILRRWGFHEENIERFYGLEEFVGISPDCFRELFGSDADGMLSAYVSTEVENRWYMIIMAP